jgi:hypothetical protein
MKKLTIKQAAKRLDFKYEFEFIEYLDDSRINGNFSQLRNLYNELNKEAKKIVLLNATEKTKTYLIQNCL